MDRREQHVTVRDRVRVELRRLRTPVFVEVVNEAPLRDIQVPRSEIGPRSLDGLEACKVRACPQRNRQRGVVLRRQKAVRPRADDEESDQRDVDGGEQALTPPKENA